MLDDKDRSILRCLQENSRMTASEIAAVVSLSVPSVSDRIRKLVDSGVITRFGVNLDHKKLGYDLTAFIAVDSSSSERFEGFVMKARSEDCVVECHSITGEGSHLLKIRARSSSDLENRLRDIQGWPGVVRTHTMLVLSTYKENATLSLKFDE